MKFSNPFDFFKSVTWMKFKNKRMRRKWESDTVSKWVDQLVNNCGIADAMGSTSYTEWFDSGYTITQGIAVKLQKLGYTVKLESKSRFGREQTLMTISWK